MKNWNVIEDDRVKHLYRCPSCNHEHRISPKFYEDSGSAPQCENTRCEDYEVDTVYIHTEILNG
jgi:hypothetical protein